MAADRSRTIDGLRGIAATAVIVQHCLEFTPIKDPDATIGSPIRYIFANDFNFGRFGVIVFFLISGFLIPSSIGNQQRPLLSFAIGRFFRLFPLYWLSIILALIVIAALGNTMPRLVEVIANFTMFQMLFGIENIEYPYWTLLIENFFYFLCVAIFLAGMLHSSHRMRLIMLASGTSIVLLALFLMIAPTMKYAVPAADLMYTAAFLFIMIVGHNIRLGQDRETFQFPKEIAILFVGVFMFICVARVMVGNYSPLLSPTSVFISTGAGLFVFALALRAHALSSRAFVYLGQISYGLYLFHGIALWIAIAFIGKPKDVLDSMFLLVLVLAMTFVTSALSFKFVEEPFIALGKSIRRGLGSPAGARRETKVLTALPVGVVMQDASRPFNNEPLP